MPLGILTIIHNFVLAVVFAAFFAIYSPRYDIFYMGTDEFGAMNYF